MTVKRGSCSYVQIRKDIMALTHFILLKLDSSGILAYNKHHLENYIGS